MPGFIFMFISVFGFLNFYVFVRGWQALPSSPGFRVAYAVIYWLVALSYIGSRGFENALHPVLTEILTWVGAFWIAALLYLFLAVLVLDALRAVNHFLPFFPGIITENYARAKCATAYVVIGAVALTLLGGFINSRFPRVNELEIHINKQAGELKTLDIVMASDIHVGTIIGRSWLEPFVDKINALNPDIVLLPGDILDSQVGLLIRENLGEDLRRINARYGVFAVPGNHEYIGGGEALIRYLTDHDITVLRDQSVKIADSFFIIGRNDRGMTRRSGQARKSLKALADEVDRKLPIILMDHQPYDLHEAEENGVDLQLSGHTHYGQFWPVNYIVRAIYEVAWGYKRKGDTHYYVSNGAGTWGPPVRVGNRPEIVLIRLTFEIPK